MLTEISQVIFTDFIKDGQHHFAADWHDTSIKYSRQLNKEVKKYGYYSGITGSSFYVDLSR